MLCISPNANRIVLQPLHRLLHSICCTNNPDPHDAWMSPCRHVGTWAELGEPCLRVYMLTTIAKYQQWFRKITANQTRGPRSIGRPAALHQDLRLALHAPRHHPRSRLRPTVQTPPK